MKNLVTVTVNTGILPPAKAKALVEEVRKNLEEILPNGTIIVVLPAGSGLTVHELAV